MLEIDCSYGEGGGQLIRTALALSAVLGKEIKLTKMRQNRANPGMAAQHITAVKAVGKLCNADYPDLKVGLQTLEFSPGLVKGGEFTFDIGTAGSITLVLQACMLPALFYGSKDVFKFKVRGGTDVNWSPTFDYFESVFIKNLETFGANVEINLIRRGYYPKGGGEVWVKIDSEAGYQKLDFTERGKLIKIYGIINNSRLPTNIPERIKRSVQNKLDDYSPIELSIDHHQDSYSPGCGVVLFANFEHSVLGASKLCKKGLPAEKVGECAVDNLLAELRSDAGVDIYAADQLIPYLALLGGTISTRKITEHTRTNIWLVEQFFNKKFKIIESSNMNKISM